MTSTRWSVRLRRQWRLFGAEPPVVRITAAGAALVLLVGVLAAVGQRNDGGRQAVASRGRAGASASPGTKVTVPGATSTTAGAGDALAGASGSGPGGVGVPGDGGSGVQAGTGVAPDGSPLTASDRGVSATKIKVVFPYADLGPIGQATGLDPGSEDEPTAITAVVNDINGSGGIFGRTFGSFVRMSSAMAPCWDRARLMSPSTVAASPQEFGRAVGSIGWARS